MIESSSRMRMVGAVNSLVKNQKLKNMTIGNNDSVVQRINKTDKVSLSREGD